MKSISGIRNEIKILGNAEHRLLKIKSYLSNHPELTGTHKLCHIYWHVCSICDHLDTRFNMETADALQDDDLYGDGLETKDIIDQCNLEKYFPNQIDSNDIDDELLYTFDDNLYGYAPLLLQAWELSNYISGTGKSPVRYIANRIHSLKDSLRSHYQVITIN